MIMPYVNRAGITMETENKTEIINLNSEFPPDNGKREKAKYFVLLLASTSDSIK